jgi:DNA-binding MarR family transcriptional regulator
VADYDTSAALVTDVERIVVASVAVTARLLSEEGAELTLSQWRVLVLVDRPGGMPVGAVAAALRAKIAAVSRLVGRLNARGLVQTRRADADGRVVLVSLTTAGRRLRRRIVHGRRAQLEKLLAESDLGHDGKAHFGQLAAALEASV